MFFDEMLPRAMTAFFMPLPRDYPPHMRITEMPFGSAEGVKVADAILNTPFPCIRIVREGPIAPGAPGWYGVTWAHADCVFERVNDGVDDGFRWATKETVKWPDGRILVRGSPDDWGDDYPDPTKVAIPVQYIRLMEALNDRKHRYIERDRLTRQQRRALGVAPEYREYIVIDKKGAPPEARTLSEIIRRHPILHAVRAHLRHYKSGLVTPVRAHARGHGQLFQVKDYKVAQ